MPSDDNPVAEASQFQIDIHSPTPIIDAIQLALLGYQFTNDEISLIERLATERRAVRERERRHLLRTATEPADPLQSLMSAVQQLTEFLAEPQLPADSQQQPAQQPAYQQPALSPSFLGGRTTSRSIRL